MCLVGNHVLICEKQYYIERFGEPCAISVCLLVIIIEVRVAFLSVASRVVWISFCHPGFLLLSKDIRLGQLMPLNFSQCASVCAVQWTDVTLRMPPCLVPYGSCDRFLAKEVKIMLFHSSSFRETLSHAVLLYRKFECLLSKLLYLPGHYATFVFRCIFSYTC